MEQDEQRRQQCGDAASQLTQLSLCRLFFFPAVRPLPSVARRYAPRGPVYVASLYREPAFDGDADACACGHSDPLHVHDAEMGFVRADGVEALRFSGRTRVGGELGALSCDAAKARAVTGPPAWQHQVDAFTSPSARRGPPPRAYNSSHGQGASLAFDDWLEAKAERALQQEARRKRQAVAELCTQVARRAQAQQAFQQWSAEKDAAAAAAPAQPALSPDEQDARRAEMEARRDAILELWRASKDAQRLEADRAALAQSQSAAAADALKREQTTFRASQAYQSWKAAVEQREAAIRSDKRRSAQQRAADLKASKQQRETRGAEMFKQWLSDKDAARQKDAKSLSEQQKQWAEKAAKHAAEVESTRLAREQRMAAHLESIIRERRDDEAALRLQRKQEHRTMWARKEIGPEAYSTTKSTKRVFR